MSDFAKDKDVPDTNVGDTISREAMGDAVNKIRVSKNETWYSFYQKVLNELCKLPSAEPRWIPVTERLPEDLEEVNVTWVNHAPEQYYDFVKDKHFTGSAVHYKGSWYWYSSTCVDILAEYGRNEMDKMDDGIEVVAYMPLPKPWKGEDNE